MATHVRSTLSLFSNTNGLLCRICRPGSQIRTFSQAIKEYDPNDIATGSEMPLMFPSQAIKKGFGVHQSPRVFTLKPSDKMSWLTKTYLTKELPVELRDYETNKEAVKMIKDCMHQISAFQKHVKRPSTSYYEEELALGLLQQMLQIAFMLGPPKNQNLFVHRIPIVETNWFRNFVFFNAKYHPSLVIRTSEPLQPLGSTFPLPIGHLFLFLFSTFISKALSMGNRNTNLPSI